MERVVVYPLINGMYTAKGVVFIHKEDAEWYAEMKNAEADGLLTKVVYGEWKLRYGCLNEFYTCTQCKKSVEYKTNYCPNCGAKMN